ncbi:hypothetical protein FRC08_016932, partial [Ceratobasidium sp. 394]
RLYLFFTIIIFSVAGPLLILVNFATVGSELVPSLQPTFQPDDVLLQGWLGTGHMPGGWRPRAPRCQPQELGRGDTFRLSASLFDYTVQSTWNTTKVFSASGVRDQDRVEYRGQSFSNCFVNTTRFDYSLVEQSQKLSVGVICKGTPDYPIHVSMETVMVFAQELSMDFIGQYYGGGQELMNITSSNPSDYRRVAMAVLEVLSTDSLTIIGGQHLPEPVLSMSLVFTVNPNTANTELATSTITYVNGTRGPIPAVANIYVPSIWNVVNAAMDAVNLDLGRFKYENLYRNATVFRQVIMPNPPPSGIPSSQWADTPDGQSFYYGTITPPYQTWAQMLLAGRPVAVGTLTGLPDESVMVTTYLCPTYRAKPISSLLSSVFVGAATMISSVWWAWTLFTAFVAKKRVAPDVQCLCSMCNKKLAKKAEEVEEDPEKNVMALPHLRPQGPNHPSYASGSTGESK